MQRKWTEDEDDIVAMMLRNLSTNLRARAQDAN